MNNANSDNTNQNDSTLRSDKRTRKAKGIAGILTTLIVNILYAPLYFGASFILMFSTKPRDPTGSGGPFKACFPGEYCVGPTGTDYLAMAVCVLVILFGWLLAGAAGQRIGNLYPKWRAIGILSIGSFIISALLVVLFIQF